MERFRVQKRAKRGSMFLVLVTIAVACVGLFELYRLLVPFDTLNPLWTQATVGQTVLGNWRYGGQDPEGYLEFYNGSHTNLIPPNSHLFAADGNFVVLERHSPNSITYALPRNAIPFSWILGGALLLAFPIGLAALRIRGQTGWKSGRRVKFRSRTTGSASGKSRFTTSGPSRSRGFRSTKTIHLRRSSGGSSGLGSSSGKGGSGMGRSRSFRSRRSSSFRAKRR